MDRLLCNTHRWPTGNFLIPPIGGPERLLMEEPVNVTGNTAVERGRRIDWSPDNKWIAYAQQRGVTLVSVDTGERREFAQLNSAIGINSAEPVFSPDGRRLAYIG